MTGNREIGESGLFAHAFDNVYVKVKESIMITKKLNIGIAIVSAALACSHAETKPTAAEPPAAPAPATEAAKPAPPPAPPAPPQTPDADFRARQPEPLATPSQFTAPVPVQRKLKNGAELLVVENHAVPLVSIEVMIETGIDGEPPGKAGLASFAAAMLEEGTKKLTAPQLAEAFEDQAIEYSANAGQETIRVHVNALSEALPRALELLAQVIAEPAFHKEDVERVRSQMRDALQAKQASPALLARDEVNRIFYGEKSPWGQPGGGTKASIDSITAADLQRFHADYFRPSNAIISVSGDVDASALEKLLEEKLAGWKKEPRRSVKLPKLVPPSQRSVVLVDVPRASQSQVWVFGPAVAANDPDAVPLRVASYVLGGPFMRLDLNIREGHGYSYGVRANVSALREHGLWIASGSVKAQVTAESLAEYENELQGLAGGELKEGELFAARQALIRSLPSSLERNDAVSSSMATLAFNGQPLDYYRSLPAKVEAVDAAELARVAKKYDRPEAWSIVIVGPKAASEEKLKAMNLGAINFRTVEN